VAAGRRQPPMADERLGLRSSAVPERDRARRFRAVEGEQEHGIDDAQRG
jgi:hypothetical protein